MGRAFHGGCIVRTHVGVRRRRPVQAYRQGRCQRATRAVHRVTRGLGSIGGGLLPMVSAVTVLWLCGDCDCAVTVLCMGSIGPGLLPMGSAVTVLCMGSAVSML